MTNVSIAQANGIEIAHQKFGRPDGNPILLIMGLSTQMLAWQDGFCQALADRGHFVIRYDNRDTGLSTHFDAAGRGRPVRALLGLAQPTYRLSDMALDAAGLLDALGLSSAHIVGISMGGMIAQSLVLIRPAKVRSLTLMSTTTGSLRVGQPQLKVLLKMITAKPARDRAGGVAHSLRMYDMIRSDGFPAETRTVEAIAGQSYDRRYDPLGGARQFTAILTAPDRTAALQRVRVPTTVIHGTRDRLVNLSGGRAIAAAIPGCRLVTIPGMGHDLPTPAWPQLVAEIATTVGEGERLRVPVMPP